MKIKTGYLYHIKDDFFDMLKSKGLMINHENGHSRPSYLAIMLKDFLWFIPLSTKVNKYKKIINHKLGKYGMCKTILIKNIAGKEQAVLIQNAFPTLEKYVNNIHMVNGKIIRISSNVEKEILDNLNYVFSMKKEGINLFFTDVDSIEKFLLEEIKQIVNN